MEADGNGEKSTTTFRWINVARYVVASVVTVLIATVVVIAIKMVMRPDTLSATVAGGYISVDSRPGLQPNQLALVSVLWTKNPSGRVVMYYYNITGYLFDKNKSASTPDPVQDSFTWFYVDNITLPQQGMIRSTTEFDIGTDDMTPSYFDMLYNNRSARIDDVTMRMEGYLVTEPISGHNTTARWTTYYCSPLVVGWAPNTTRGGQNDDEDSQNKQGSGLCTEVLKSTVTSAR